MTTFLVTGANGKLGRHVTQLLLDAKAGTVVAASRDPSQLADLAARGAQTRRADFDDPASLDGAFKGVDRLLIISTDSLGTGRRLAQHAAAVAAAKTAGVGHIVYTSMPKPETSAVTFAGDHLGTENTIKATGIPYTILRNSWYQENLLTSLPAALKGGQWYSSAMDGRTPYIAHADCARAAAAALIQAPANQTFTLTGPELLTAQQIAALASKVTGKPLHVVEVTDEELAAGMAHAGLPEAINPMLVSFDTNTRQGGFDILTDDVETLTGQKPSPVEAFLAANVDALLA
jgi:NAD(P)H dehydrogenase (quinone)